MLLRDEMQKVKPTVYERTSIGRIWIAIVLSILFLELQIQQNR